LILIFTVDYYPKTGSGIANYTFNLARSLHRLGENVLVLAPHMGGDREFDSLQDFKTIRVTNNLLVREMALSFLLPIIVKRYKVRKIINMMWVPCGILSMFLNGVFSVPYIVAAFGCEIMENLGRGSSLGQRIKNKLRFLKYKTFRYAETIISISNYTKGILVQQGIEEKKIHVLHGGVDLDEFKEMGFIDRYNLKGKRVILTVARLDDYKGIDKVLNALPRVLKEVPETFYLVVGDGPDKKRLNDLVASLGLIDRVKFTGEVSHEEAIRHMNSCEIFIMTTRPIIPRGEVEGFGIVFVEAGALGKPVIGGVSGGTVEAIVDGVTGLLVNPEKTEDIASALLKLLKDPDYARQLGENGRKRVEKELNWSVLGRRAKEIIYGQN